MIVKAPVGQSSSTVGRTDREEDDIGSVMTFKYRLMGRCSSLGKANNITHKYNVIIIGLEVNAIDRRGLGGDTLDGKSVYPCVPPWDADRGDAIPPGRRTAASGVMGWHAEGRWRLSKTRRKSLRTGVLSC
jgi:hypothetical protein